MANQFSKGHVFVPGEVVDPDDLNNLVDLATSVEGIISSQPVESPPANSSEVIVGTVAGVLRRRQVSTLPHWRDQRRADRDTDIGVSSDWNSGNRFRNTRGSDSGSVAEQTFCWAEQWNGDGAGWIPHTGSSGCFGAHVSDYGESTIDWSLSNTFDKTLTASPRRLLLAM